MDERELKRGFRNGWILAILLVLLVAFLTAFTFWVHRDQVPPHWVQGNKPFVPGQDFGVGYETPEVEAHAEER